MSTPHDTGEGLELLARGIVSGSLFRNLTGDHRIALLNAVDGPSGWPLRPEPVADWKAYLGRVGAPSRWQPPDVDVSPGVVAEFVERARTAALDHVRVVVDDIAAWRRITSATVTLPSDAAGELPVSAYVRGHGGPDLALAATGRRARWWRHRRRSVGADRQRTVRRLV